jgi:hypothetical protein
MNDFGNDMFWRLRNIKPGGKIVYYTGYLPIGRSKDRNPGSWEMVDILGAVAWELSDRRKCHLTQRKLGDLNYEYIATGASAR